MSDRHTRWASSCTRWPTSILAIAAIVCACDGTDAPADGAPDDVDAGASLAVAPPSPPASPNLTPCPDGWREVTGDGVTICEPWPETGAPSCVPGTMALPGVDGCAPLGAECPTGDLPEEPASGGPFVYVLAGATAGDGSRLSPFGTIAEAMDFASPGSTILVGAGTYDERVVPKQGITLAGLCPRRTILTRTDSGGGEAIVSINQDGVTIRDLAIADAAHFGVVARAGSSRLEGVLVELLEAPAVGVADAATLTIAGSTIRNSAHGVEVIVGGTVLIEGSVVADNGGPGVAAIGGEVTVRRSWLADNRNIGEPGFGAIAQDGGTVVVEESVVSGNADIGLTAGAGGTLQVRDTLIEEQRTDRAGEAGFGVEAEGGSTVLLERVTLRRNRSGGVFVQGAGTSLTARDVAILDTQPQDDGQFGRALAVQEGAEAVVERAIISESRELAVLLSGPTTPTSLRLQDVEIRDTVPQSSDGESGRGISAQHEVRLELERVRIVRCHGIGIHVAGRDGRNPTASLVDVEVVDVAPEIESGVRNLHGRALQIEVGADVSGSRLRADRAHEVALVVFEATAELSDVALVDTLARQSDDTIGRGLVVQGGATLTLDGAHLERTRDVAAFVADPGSRLVARRFSIVDALARGCADAACASEPGGHGLGVYDGAAADVTDFRIARAALCGVHLAGDAAIDLHDGVVREARFGACVQVDGYDVDRLSDGVRYEDNVVNLEGTSLPVPEGVDSLDL